MPKVKKLKGKWKHQELTPPPSPEEEVPINHPIVMEPMMNGFLQGPIVVNLGPGTPYNHAQISQYISFVLQLLKIENAYGLLAGIAENQGPIVPTIIFGIPPPNVLPLDLPTTPYGLPILVKQDWIISGKGFDAVWNHEKVENHNRITLGKLSVGVEGCRDTAGSFGGFLKKSSSPADRFGITAAHCLPGMPVNTIVCSPSTAEVTARFKLLRRYTTLCPIKKRLHINQEKEIEARSLLVQFPFIENPSGVSLLDPAAGYQWKKGVLSGSPVGHIVVTQFGNYEHLLHNYDQSLTEHGHPLFMADPSWVTRLDWSIFTCEPTRCGGNVYEGDVVEKIGLLYPGAQVQKIGRSTGSKTGRVNGYFLQRWHDDVCTHEIAITGSSGRSFAEVGDSGGCVFVKVGEEFQAAGILIGINHQHDLTLVTPLPLILASVPEYEWA